MLKRLATAFLVVSVLTATAAQAAKSNPEHRCRARCGLVGGITVADCRLICEVFK